MSDQQLFSDLVRVLLFVVCCLLLFVLLFVVVVVLLFVVVCFVVCCFVVCCFVVLLFVSLCLFFFFFFPESREVQFGEEKRLIFSALPIVLIFSQRQTKTRNELLLEAVQRSPRKLTQISPEIHQTFLDISTS